MGFFSWKTQDSNDSICNVYSTGTPFTVFMKDNQGNVWEESEYQGYGEFGGKEYYELLAEMNGLKHSSQGIELAYSGKPYLSPNLFSNQGNEWTNSVPLSCPNQGYFYENFSWDEDPARDEYNRQESSWLEDENNVWPD